MEVTLSVLITECTVILSLQANSLDQNIRWILSRLDPILMMTNHCLQQVSQLVWQTQGNFCLPQQHRQLEHFSLLSETIIQSVTELFHHHRVLAVKFAKMTPHCMETISDKPMNLNAQAKVEREMAIHSQIQTILLKTSVIQPEATATHHFVKV